MRSIGWDVVREVFDLGLVSLVEDHFLPADDHKPHTTGRDKNGCYCWCKPEYRDTADTKLYCEVIHNSADGREKFEEVSCLLN